MKPLELSFRLNCVSTSPRSKHFRSISHAKNLTKTYLSYICRQSAASGFSFHGNYPKSCSDISSVRSRLRHLVSERADRGGTVGVRVFDRGMMSFPNDFPLDACEEALGRFLKSVVPDDSDAAGFAVVHTDKPENLHAHFFFVDGLESETSALARGHKKRLRRRDALRLNEKGSPARLRALAAESINSVARERGLTLVEHRSYADRGLVRRPTRHDGPTRRRLGHARSKRFDLFARAKHLASLDADEGPDILKDCQKILAPLSRALTR